MSSKDYIWSGCNIILPEQQIEHHIDLTHLDEDELILGVPQTSQRPASRKKDTKTSRIQLEIAYRLKSRQTTHYLK